MSHKHLPIIILIENEDKFIQPIIKAHGFRVVHLIDHNEDTLANALAEFPHAVGIVSDVDTDHMGDGVRWAQTYIKQDNAKPLAIISCMPTYKENAEKLGVPFFQKPLLNHPHAETRERVMADFKSGLESWLDGLKNDRGLNANPPPSVTTDNIHFSGIGPVFEGKTP